MTAAALRITCAAAAMAAPLLVGCTSTAPWRGLVKIGLVLSFHGGDTQAAMATHIAVRQTLIDRNRQGGLGGWRLELVSLDDDGDPAVAAQRVAELATDPDVVAVLAPAGGLETAPSAQAGVPLRTLPSVEVAPAVVDGLLSDVAAALNAGTGTGAALRDRIRK